MTVPLFVQLLDPEVKDLENSRLTAERAFFGNFSETGVDALNGAGGVHDPPNLATVVEQLLNVPEIVFPYAHGTRVFAPRLAETLEFDRGR